MYPYGPGPVPGPGPGVGFFGVGWSWWAIAFLIAFAVFFLIAAWYRPYRPFP